MAIQSLGRLPGAQGCFSCVCSQQVAGLTTSVVGQSGAACVRGPHACPNVAHDQGGQINVGLQTAGRSPGHMPRARLRPTNIHSID
jgi:hypothetical protein